MSVAAINVVLQPHSADLYVSLIKKLCRKRTPVVYRGHGYLLNIYKPVDSSSQQTTLLGQICRFADIDQKAAWVNIMTLKVADDEEISEINIPEKLRPNFVSFNFVFDVRKHLFCFETFTHSKTGPKHISAYVVRSVLELFFKGADFTSEFGQVNLTIIPERDSVKKILEIPKLRKLQIELMQPNPDDLEELERRMLQKLKKQKASKQTTILNAEEGESLEPDIDVQTMATVAARNGVVRGEGKDGDGKPIVQSTEEHPRVVTKWYDSSAGPLNVLKELVREFFNG
jgi:hypothetical protein